MYGMKKNMLLKGLLIVSISLFSIAVSAQSLSDVLNNKETPIYYFGIDFTKAVLIGDDKANGKDIIERQLAGINELMVNEPKKYDIAGAFRKSEINSDLSFVAKRNEKINESKFISSSSEDYNHLTEADITPLIKGFNVGNKTGTGLLFVVDAMSKPKKAVSVWVTLFDTKSKKILLTERVEGAVGMGFSFRNYWATGFKKVIDQIASKKYKEWSTK